MAQSLPMLITVDARLDCNNGNKVFWFDEGSYEMTPYSGAMNFWNRPDGGCGWIFLANARVYATGLNYRVRSPLSGVCSYFAPGSYPTIAAAFNSAIGQSVIIEVPPGGSWVDFGQRDSWCYDNRGVFTVMISCPDSDRDGICDSEDACPFSDTSPTVVIDGCDTGVSNVISESGCSITDEILAAANSAKNYGQFRSWLNHYLSDMMDAGILNKNDAKAIKRCALSAK